MKFSLLTLLSFTLSTAAMAQTDSLAVVKADWNVRKITRGVKLRQFTFNKSLFSSNQNVSILEVKQRGRRFFDLGYEPRTLRTTSDFGKAAGAIASLNGTFFDIKNGGSVDFIESDDHVINDNRLNKDGGRSLHQQAAILLNDGQLSLSKWNGEPAWERTLEAEDIMVTGPLLLTDGRAEVLDTANVFNKTRHPRTAVAVTGNKRVLLITVDGRHENSTGMSLFELTKLLKWLGARQGINLDGGGSTALWVSNDSGGSVVNYPSDNKKWDHEGERKVANVILLRKR
ncbi:phosphodiester glycosidase family protein [Flavihumibacter sp. R14]|nr:phosphodiester glycosidase family protein [Flavihumibacter soli]